MVEWTGNLNDDCRAQWNGIRMHAEQMGKRYWWWAIYDEKNEVIDSSNEYQERLKSGKLARQAAETAARKYANI